MKKDLKIKIIKNYIATDKNKNLLKLYAFNHLHKNCLIEHETLKEIISLQTDEAIDKIGDLDICKNHFNIELLKDVNVLIYKEIERLVIRTLDSMDRGNDHIIEARFTFEDNKKEERENVTIEKQSQHTEKYNKLWSE